MRARVPVSRKVSLWLRQSPGRTQHLPQHCIILPVQPGTLDTFPIALTSPPVRPRTLDTFPITRSPAPVRPGAPHPNPSTRRGRAELIPALRPSGKQKPGLAGGGRARKEKEAKSRSLAFWPDFLGKERCGRSVCARREGPQARWRAARAPDARPGSRAGSGRRRPHNGVISASALQRPPLPARIGTDCPGAPRLRTHSLALGRRARQGTSKAPSSLGIADAAMLSCIVFLIPLGRTRGHESPGEGTNSPGSLCDAGDPWGFSEQGEQHRLQSDLRGHRAPFVPECPPSHSPAHSRIRSNLLPGE